MTISKLSWHIVPTRTPAVVRACPRCNDKQRFFSTDKFRINRNRQHLDVWLIYACEQCGSTWNCSILRRIAQDRIQSDLYERFVNNDRYTAWQYAFDFSLFARNQVGYEASVEYRVEGTSPLTEACQATVLEVSISFEFPIPIRLDNLLKKRLHLSRRQLVVLLQNRGVRLAGKNGTTKLPKKVRQCCDIEVDLYRLRGDGIIQ